MEREKNQHAKKKKMVVVCCGCHTRINRHSLVAWTTAKSSTNLKHVFNFAHFIFFVVFCFCLLCFLSSLQFYSTYVNVYTTLDIGTQHSCALSNWPIHWVRYLFLFFSFSFYTLLSFYDRQFHFAWLTFWIRKKLLWFLIIADIRFARPIVCFGRLSPRCASSAFIFNCLMWPRRSHLRWLCGIFIEHPTTTGLYRIKYETEEWPIALWNYNDRNYEWPKLYDRVKRTKKNIPGGVETGQELSQNADFNRSHWIFGSFFALSLPFWSCVPVQPPKKGKHNNE